MKIHTAAFKLFHIHKWSVQLISRMVQKVMYVFVLSSLTVSHLQLKLE